MKATISSMDKITDSNDRIYRESKMLLNRPREVIKASKASISKDHQVLLMNMLI